MILSSSCFFNSSEKPICSKFRRVDRPPPSKDCSVISDSRRDIAPSSSGSRVESGDLDPSSLSVFGTAVAKLCLSVEKCLEVAW